MTLEFLTIGLGVGLAESLFASNRLRLRGLIAAAVLFAVNIAATRQSGAGIMAARAVAGLAEGVLGWIVSLMITRSSTPARLNGIFLVAQGLAQILFAAILPLTLMKTLGANGGFYALAGTAIVAGAAVLVIPDDMMPLPEAQDEPGARKGERYRVRVYRALPLWFYCMPSSLVSSPIWANSPASLSLALNWRGLRSPHRSGHRLSDRVWQRLSRNEFPITPSTLCVCP